MRNIVIQNLTITLISKFFSFISFALIAKYLSEADYGNYIFIIMVLSLLPLLQFGSMHGTVLLYPKFIVNQDKDEKELFIYSNYISHFFQLCSFFLLFFIDFNLSNFIVFIIGSSFLLSLYNENCIKYLNSIFKFQKSNIINGFNQVMKPLTVLLFFYIFKSIESIFAAYLFVNILTVIISFFIIEIKITNLKIVTLKKIFKAIYKIGFYVYLSWSIDIIFRTVDRWFILNFYSLEELALYGFTSSLALNIWLVAMSFFVPYTQLLYRSVAEKKYIESKKIINNTNKKLLILLFIISLIAIVCYPFFIEFFVKKYFNSEFLFFVLVLCSIFLSINNMYIYYMISNGFHFLLLKFQVVILILNLILNSIFVFFHLDIIFYSYSTLVSLLLYFLLVKRFVDKNIIANLNQ